MFIKIWPFNSLFNLQIKKSYQINFFKLPHINNKKNVYINAIEAYNHDDWHSIDFCQTNDIFCQTMAIVQFYFECCKQLTSYNKKKHKKIKYTRNLFRKNLQLKGVCLF